MHSSVLQYTYNIYICIFTTYMYIYYIYVLYTCMPEVRTNSTAEDMARWNMLIECAFFCTSIHVVYIRIPHTCTCTVHMYTWGPHLQDSRGQSAFKHTCHLKCAFFFTSIGTEYTSVLNTCMRVATVSRINKIIGLFCKRACKRDDILQKRPIISSILLTVATPYDTHICLRSELTGTPQK